MIDHRITKKKRNKQKVLSNSSNSVGYIQGKGNVIFQFLYGNQLRVCLQFCQSYKYVMFLKKKHVKFMIQSKF